MPNAKTLTLGALLLSSPAWADCTAPDEPALPDGATATMEEMLAGQKDVKRFQEANTDYRKCVEARIKAAKTATEEAESKTEATEAQATYARAVESFNAAVATEEAVAGEFNTQVREFKAASQD